MPVHFIEFNAYFVNPFISHITVRLPICEILIEKVTGETKIIKRRCKYSTNFLQ